LFSFFSNKHFDPSLKGTGMMLRAVRGEAGRAKGALDSLIMTAAFPRPVMRVKVSHIHDFAFLGHSDH
jgi:hypothetical protein